MTSTKHILSIARELIAIPSVSSDIAQLDACIDYIASQFSGYQHALIEKVVFNHKPSLLVQNFTWTDADIILNGHIDVVAATTEGQFSPYEKDGRLYARGAGDMKAGVALMIQVMKDILDQGFVEKRVCLMITSDEEVGWFDGVHKLVDETWYSANVVLIPDGGATDEVVIGQKGIYMFTVEAQGKACHSSRPWLGVNALHHIVNYFITLRETLQDTQKVYFSDDHRGTSVNLNVMQWWHTMNAVPDKAIAKIDIRFTERYKLGDIKKIVLDNMPSFNCRLIDGLSGEILYTDPNDNRVQEYMKVAQTFVDKPISVGKEHGWSDGRFFAWPNTAVIIHRPTCDNIHASDERVDIDSIATIYHIYKKFIIW